VVRMQRVLLVEDNPSDSKIMRFILEKKGYVVHSTEDVYGTIDAINRYPFDLIFLDWMLPHINGIDILKTIRQDSKHKDLPVIITTSRSETRDIKRAVEAGVTDYIVKPIDAVVLETKMKRVLKNSVSFQLVPLLNQEGELAQLATEAKVKALSENHLQFESDMDWPSGHVIKINCPLFLRLGVGQSSVKILNCRKSQNDENIFIVEAVFVDLQKEDFHKIRVYLHTLKDVVN
jgi:DNA-binding response OmpR family regulator